jgi:hypothetical protein
MDRPHDLGGASGYGQIDTTPDGEPFHHEWEARVFALNRLLLSKNLYTLDEFRDRIERMTHEEYRQAGYYERWLHAIEVLLAEKDVLHA